MSGPPPPPDLATRTVRFVTLRPGAIIHRFWTITDGSRRFDPIYYDRALSGRLNAPNGSYGVLYAAEEPYGAFAETFLRTPGNRMIDPGLLNRKAYVRLRVSRTLNLIHFDGASLPILGATAAVVHGDVPYDNSQAWSAALRAHPAGADGIAYTARHDPSQLCYAIFDGPDPAVVEAERREDLDALWFWDLADHYKVGRAP